MAESVQVLGTVAGVMTTVAFVPQVIKVWCSRSAADISASMYAFFLGGLFLWMAYGWCIGSWPILVANLVTAVLAGAIVVMKFKFRTGGRP